MTYQDTTEYLFNQVANYESQGTNGYKVGLDNMLKLDEHFGHPHESFRSIHVAGTNGKGSVSHTIAAMLEVYGYRVGLYTSPHLVDFSERIKVNGTPITEEYVIQFVDKNKELFNQLKPSFFEITTTMVFSYFKKMDVDIAVIEVGLGGRLDSTNIITPILSVITNISLDHTQFLGNTLEKIAAEKAGIIKSGVPVVIGESTVETRPVFEAVAKEKGSPIYFAEDEKEKEIMSAEPLSDGGFLYHCKHLASFKGELGGMCQPKNTNTILCAMHRLMDEGYLAECYDPENNAKIQKEMTTAFRNVTKITGLQGRWQTLKTQPKVVCDTGHNTGGWEYLSQQLASVECNQLRIVFGVVEDKDIYGIMQMLPKNAIYYFTKANTKRALPETSLKVFGDQFGLTGNCYPSVLQAYQAAINDAQDDDFIFVGGSSYVVADLLKSIN